MMAVENTVRSKQLADLGIPTDKVFAEVEIQGIELDSRKVSAGDLFLAFPGHTADGRDYIDQAIEAGAAAVFAEKSERWCKDSLCMDAPVIVVENLPAKISQIAGRFYDDPSASIPVVGVTGTNGKTSCTQLVMQLFNRLKMSCGVVGTLGVGVDGEFEEGVNTTPDAVYLQHILAHWRDHQVPVAVMEVSSHGLEQGRVEAVQFQLAMFTNLSRDHLDYHGNMQSYAEAKSLLFKQQSLQVAILNNDDDYVDSLADVVSEGVKIVRYSIKPSSPGTDLWLENIVYHTDSVSARLHSPWGVFDIVSPLLGQFNLSNVIAVIACFGSLGFSVSSVVKELANINVIAGRMEQVSIASQSDISVVVDYAHTPDALEKALQAMRQHSKGKLWCVFGCGGDRDQGKRPQMGSVAQRMSDYAVVTSDNPRSESAGDIINEILGGIDRPALVEEDRATAINTVIENAKPGDSVLIAGKGHEDYQLIGKQKLPFSDIKQARLALARRAERALDGNVNRNMSGGES